VLVSRDNLLSIGSFGLLTGLSVTTLRHYDDAGILEPAFVDPGTSYRYYHPHQVRHARVIRRLRAVDLPLNDIKGVLDTAEEADVRDLLVKHRERLAREAEVLSEQLTVLDELIEKGVDVPAVRGNRIVMINIAVEELEPCRRFYEEALGVEFAEETHGDGPVHLNATFGEWNTDSWFLVALWPSPELAGTVNIGFLVEDLDATYQRALGAGGADEHGPRDEPGMPRFAQVRDPSGNHIGLYQG